MINNKPPSEQTSWQDRLSCRLFSLLYTTAIVEAVVQYTLQRFAEEASLRECLLRIEQLFWNSWLSLPPFWSFARPPKRSQKTLRVKFVPRFPIVSGVGNWVYQNLMEGLPLQKRIVIKGWSEQLEVSWEGAWNTLLNSSFYFNLVVHYF